MSTRCAARQVFRDSLTYATAAQDSGRKRKPLFKQKPEEDCYDISRYQPSMRFMLQVRFSSEHWKPKRC